MAKVSKTSVYPVKAIPSQQDYFPATDSEDNLNTVSIKIGSVIALFQEINGGQNIQYEFSDGSNEDIDYNTPGMLFTENNNTQPGTFTKLHFNKLSLALSDLEALFLTISELENIVITLKNPANQNVFFNFKIISTEIFPDYFVFEIENFEDFFQGEFVDGTIYSFYFDIKGSGGIKSVTGDSVDNTDPVNPVIKAIPLSGTTEGNPVTGDIEIGGNGSYLQLYSIKSSSDKIYTLFNSDENSLSQNSESADYVSTTFNTPQEASLRYLNKNTAYVTVIGVTEQNVNVDNTDPLSKGIIGNVFYDKQNDPNAFAQLGDITSISGDFVPNSEKGQNLGVATLDLNGKIPLTQINDALIGSVNYQGNYNASTNTPALPLATGNKGKYYVVTVAGTQQGLALTNGDWIISNGTIWEKVDSNNDVTSVAGKTGAVTLVVADIDGLSDSLALKANDAYVVHKTGNLDELINGKKTFFNTTTLIGNDFGASAILYNSNTPTTGITWMEVRGPGINSSNCLYIGQYGDTAGVNRGKVLISNQSSSPNTAPMAFATNKIERFIIGADGNSQFTGNVSLGSGSSFFNTVSPNIFNLNVGSTTASGQVSRNRNDGISAFAVKNLNASSTGAIADFESSTGIVVSIGIDGRVSGSNAVNSNDFVTKSQLGTAGSFSGAGTATTVFKVTIGSAQPNNTYKINVTPTNILSAAVFYVTKKTTTTFDVVYLAELTGTVEFDWQLKP